MNRQIQHSLLLAFGTLILTGCAGYDRILFATKTNVGLDIDDKPPTAEITIARRELAITPTFQDATDDEKTLPLLASFGLTGNFLNPEITSRFAGGNAALIIAQGPNHAQDPNHLTDSSNPSKSSLCLSKKPDMRPLWKKIWHFVTFRNKKNVNDDTRAFYFATDTAFGLKAAWDGVTGPYPSTIKLGYNRRELAFPPIFATPGCSDSSPSSNDSDDSEYKGPWKVTVPSFVATLDNSSTLKERFESGVTHIQFFATGKAASAFVSRPEVNAAMNRTMYPHAEIATAAVSQPLSITPSSHVVLHGQSFEFKTAGGVPPFKFTISDNQSGSTIGEATGIYKAGNTADKTDKVKVTDSSSPPNSVEATVSVQ